MKRDAAHWQDRYVAGDLPWDSGEADPHLTDHVAQYDRIARALDVGCGTGTNTIWLAAQGIAAAGVDIAPRAIEMARNKAAEVGVANVAWHVADLSQTSPVNGGAFDLVFDRGCFHTLDAAQRKAYIANLAAVLAGDGHYLLLAGNADEVRGPDAVAGPPQVTVSDLAAAIEPRFEIIDLRRVWFQHGDRPTHMAWRVLSRKREAR